MFSYFPDDVDTDSVISQDIITDPQHQGFHYCLNNSLTVPSASCTVNSSGICPRACVEQEKQGS